MPDQPSPPSSDRRARVAAWVHRWRPLLPIFVAELIALIGFGALLPVLPLFIQDQGIDTAHLGLIIAAWPLAKLIFEPIFGWWADRHARKPQMVIGIVALSVVSLLPLFFSSFLALFALRFIAGMCTAAYDPAARGMITEATDEDERGEAFGFYASFQVAGFVMGPALGGVGAAVFGGYAFPFVATAVLTFLAAMVLAFRLRPDTHVVEAGDLAHHPGARPGPAGEAFSGSELAVVPEDKAPDQAQAPLRAVFNRTVVTALVLSFGLHLTFGTYEVVWALYLVALGATVGWVGVSFVLFAIPELFMGPIAGRWVDRNGPLRPIIITGITITITGTVYALSRSYLLSSFVAPIEAAATASMMPALYMLLGRGTPPGRASTTQGLFGATGTLAMITASVVAGALFEIHIGLPFVFFVVGIVTTMTVGLLLYRTLPSAQPESAAERSG